MKTFPPMNNTQSPLSYLHDVDESPTFNLCNFNTPSLCIITHNSFFLKLQLNQITAAKHQQNFRKSPMNQAPEM